MYEIGVDFYGLMVIVFNNIIICKFVLFIFIYIYDYCFFFIFVVDDLICFLALVFVCSFNI